MKYICEHLEPELFEWSILEYRHMVQHVGEGNLIIANLSPEICNCSHKKIPGAVLTSKSAREYIGKEPAILLDQCAEKELSPSDDSLYKYIICGGILGTDEFDGPMVDRTGEIRQQQYCDGRHLGLKQMTADTAVIVSKKILSDQICLSDMKFIDKPNIPIRKKETIEMPFRYLISNNSKNNDEPMLPNGMIELLRENDF